MNSTNEKFLRTGSPRTKQALKAPRTARYSSVPPTTISILNRMKQNRYDRAEIFAQSDAKRSWDASLWPGTFRVELYFNGHWDNSICLNEINIRYTWSKDSEEKHSNTVNTSSIDHKHRESSSSSISCINWNLFSHRSRSRTPPHH